MVEPDLSAPRPTRATASSELVMIADPDGVRAEAIRALRTHVIARHLDAGRRALVVCSAHAESGAPFVAANLATSLAQIGLNTLLIDADLRTASLDVFFPISGAGRGLRQSLSSDAPTSLDEIERDVIPSLALLRSGGVASNPLELLGDHQFAKLITACLQTYDATVVNTPPANVGADAVRISTVVGYSLIVARDQKSRVVDIEMLAKELSVDGVKVVGSVLYAG